MTQHPGRPYRAMPGPSIMPDRVLRAMHRAAPDIYHGPMVDMVPGMVSDLKVLAGTDGDLAIYISNGHGAWEAALTNVFSRGERALALVTGRFTHGWAEMAQTIGVQVDEIDYGARSAVEIEPLEAALRADSAHEIRAILVAHVDTSTSVLNDIRAIRQVLGAVGHPALLMVDCIASFMCDRIEMDAWGVDVLVAASQKGLMTPPGLGFVFFSEKAGTRRRTANCVTRYWDWSPRAKPEFFAQYFGGTAPTHHLFGLRAALDMILEEGRDAVFERHKKIAEMIWLAAEHWGRGGPLELNILLPSERSHAVTTFRLGDKLGLRLRHWTERKAGVTLGIGMDLGEAADDMAPSLFRIGHMGHVNAAMVMGVLSSVEAGMVALKIPHGSGALEAAAQAMAR